MTRYRPCDLDRLGDGARRQIAAAKYAFEARDALAVEKRHKYGAKPFTDADGTFHASRLEGERWGDLKRLHRAGLITNLIHQPRFALEINGVLICRYVADAEYIDAEGKRVIEDCKGVTTPVYRIKRALMAAILGLSITEIRR